MRIKLREISEDEGFALWEGIGYSDYIRENCEDDRVICDGDTLLEAMEDNYLFDEYLGSLGLTL